jgi:hypothetical protein
LVFQLDAGSSITNLVWYVKKTLHAVEQNRADVKQNRNLWKRMQKEMPASNIVFLDESGVNTGMTRLYGRAYKNERIVDYVPDARFHRTTILSSMR